MTTPTITRYRGDTAPDRFLIVGEDGAVEDVTTGFTFRLTVSREENPTSTAGQVYSLIGSVFNGPAGLVDFAPTQLQADQAPGEYYYDVQVTFPSGAIKTVEKGKYIYTQDITKS